MKSQEGMTLVEVIVAAGIMGVVAMGMATMHLSQLKANNFVEYQLKKQELKSEIMGQFLDSPLT
jgi:prepilin-type N-terminal cleavage/methylation domain-containing protein